MEELSRAEFERLTNQERTDYLKQLFGGRDGVDNDDESLAPSDSEDEDWFPADHAGILSSSSDSEEYSADDPATITRSGRRSIRKQADEVYSESDDDSDVEDEAVAEAAVFPEDETHDAYVVKDKRGNIIATWNKTSRSQHQTPVRNTFRQKAGPHRSTESLSMSNTFKKIMTPEISDIIVRSTNQKAKAVYQEYNTKNPDKPPRTWREVTVQETYGFLGILIGSGVNNSNTDHLTRLFTSSSFPLYRASMGYNRMISLLRFIRFDDSRTRARLATDKAAPISEIWNMLNSNLFAMYRPTENLTIDEQLFPFRGRTKFTQYIPSKPAKYGIKVWWICDAENAYPLKGIIYTGKSADGRETNQGERVVKELAISYKGSVRNITLDNFFTTLPLAEQLLSWNLTLVGTLRKNKPYIPRAFAASKTREELTSVFGFQKQVTLCSYVPKKKKAVILLSSMHTDASVADDEKKKARNDIIL